MSSQYTSFLFDLDGTLIDSVYDHVLAWRDAFAEEAIELSVWRIHRRIGVGAELLIPQLLRETGLQVEERRIERLIRLHAEAYRRHAHALRALPGAPGLLASLAQSRIPWAIATSGRMETTEPTLAALGVDLGGVPVVTGDVIRYSKPHPEAFLAAANALGVEIGSACVVGDSTWDMQAAHRAGALGIGLLSGGYGRNDLDRSGASRIYDDPADLLKHIDEVLERH